ncbi:hypothetical protein [Vogesella sp. XCS3]|uniref:hypothetical protein n=1 Tax=Vogesella sp. XCS3 TaxID=2877939 RepID=UPI001D0B07F1|nr:hypothetical protein [Vogesella sp. XCS3]UDM16308.1 hypothetical protein LCH97_13550 [Vogesella sp. XCS3]
MKSLLSMLLCWLVFSAGNTALANPPPPGNNAPPLERADALRLRELRLREAVVRGEISEEEARRLRQFYRRHDAIRLHLPPDRLASMPAGEAPPKAWQRWRKKQDRLNAPPPEGGPDS